MARSVENQQGRIESYDVHGGKIVVFGDLHVSSIFSGQHKHYLTECYENMDRMTDIVQKEKASAVIFLGDLVGVNEKAIRDRQVLMRFMMFLSMLNKVTDGNVYSVKGNHDCGDFTDFDLLCGLGLIKNPEYINYYGRRPGSRKDDGLEVRFHLVNYGDENRKLKLTDPAVGASDIVLGHNEYTIAGVTNWYSKGQGIELSSLGNFCGVSMVVSGHIHQPSEEILYTTMKDGNPIGLFYTGAPSRVIERFDDCWYFTFWYDESDGVWSTLYNAELFGLQPASEVFYDSSEFVGEDEDDERSQRLEQSNKLTDIVKEIMESRLTSGDLNRQIDIVPGVSPEVKAIAKKYLELATSGK